jgi:hypothetical protein
MSTTEDQRRELEAQLQKLNEQAEAEKAERQQMEAQARDAQMDPEQKARKDEIERQANEALEREYPPAWTPHKGTEGHPAQIVGLVERIDPRVGPSRTYGTYSAVLEIRSTDGRTWTVWANEQGALYAQMIRLRVQPGEVIAIRYRGKKESETNPGWSYHDYRMVRVGEDGPNSPVDYEQLARSSEAPALPAGGEPQADDDIPF